jgi:hypothetical protein
MCTRETRSIGSMEQRVLLVDPNFLCKEALEADSPFWEVGAKFARYFWSAEMREKQLEHNLTDTALVREYDPGPCVTFCIQRMA